MAGRSASGRSRHQFARDDEMLGQPMRLVVADERAAGPLVHEGAGEEFQRQGQQQQRQQPAEQADRQEPPRPQRRVTSVFSI
jgi:hypothetical protein